MGSVVLTGASSGATTITPTDGVTATVTLPSTGGTLQTSGAGFTTNGVAYASSASALTTGSALTFDGSNFKFTGSDNNNLVYSANSNGTSSIRMQSNAAGNYLVSAGPSAWYLQNSSSSGFISFAPASSNEAMRLDSSGKLLINKTSSSAAEAVQVAGLTLGGTDYCYFAQASTSSTANAMRIYSTTTGSVVGSITFTSSLTTYNSTSDYRLKNITGPLTGAEAKDFVMALQPKQGSWKTDGSKFVGFIAHEFQAISPSSVVGSKDAVDEEGNPLMQSMQASSAEVIANLVAFIQELSTLITAQSATIQSLTERITALENK